MYITIQISEQVTDNGRRVFYNDQDSHTIDESEVQEGLDIGARGKWHGGVCWQAPADSAGGQDAQRV